MSYRCQIMGSGSSGGVPRIDGSWGACDPAEPKNRRRRCSLLVQGREAGAADSTNIVIDTSPDLREQVLDSGIDRIDAVLLTHDHADQTHGMDDLRALVYKHRRRIPVWMEDYTAKTIKTRFAYCFAELDNSGYPSILEHKEITPDLPPITIDGPGGAVQIRPFWQQHGRIRSLGYRIGDIAYSSDISDLPDESLPHLEGVTAWIVDALRYDPHPTHFHLEKTLAMIDQLGIANAILTNLHIDMDYQTLCETLPPHVRPAYDGMIVECDSI